MKLKLILRRKEASDTESFTFQPKKKVEYLPGQFYYFTLPKLKFDDSRGPTRHFTLSSSPTEGENIAFTTRLRKDSGYKQTLKTLKKGDIIEGHGPNGTFILDEKEPGPHVLLAGGIGITPFRSFLKYHIDKNLSTKFHLIYGNKIPELISFRKELESWNKNYENIKIDMTITRPEESKTNLPAGRQEWIGLTGRMDENMISNLIKGYNNPTYWVVGPPPMVDALEETLNKLNISTNKIITEKFTGY